MQNFMRIAAALALLLVLAPLASAAPFSVQSSAVYDSIIEGERAAFDIRLVNNQDSTDSFRFSTNDLLWDMLSDPLYHYFSGVEVRPGDSQVVRLILSPNEPLEYGRYRVDVLLKGEKAKTTETIPLFITVRPAKPLIQEYLAAVNKIVEIAPVVNPLDNVSVKVNLINRNPKNLEKVTLVFSSNLLNRETTASLGPLERKTIEESFSLDSMTPPQNDTLTVKLIVDGSVLEPTITESYSVGSFPNIVQEYSGDKKSLFRTVTSATYVNHGNILGSTVVEHRAGYLGNYFTKSQPASFEIIRDGRRYLAWDLALQPGESVTIVRDENYRPLALLFFLIGGAILLYYLFRSPVSVIKRVSILTLKDSGISDLKVIIHLKNRTNRIFERVTVTDAIQTLSDVSPGADVGTLKPDSVYNDGAKTVVKWEIDNIDSGEERILSYTLHAKLAILDSLILPPVVVRFYTEKGSKVVTRSDAVTVRV